MKKTPLFAIFLFVLLLAAACTPAAQEEAILTVGDKGYTRSELVALGTLTVDYTDKDGETTAYEGVSLAVLLEDAGITGENLTFTAADDYAAELPAGEARSCENCLVAFDEDSLRLVMPDFSGKLQVKDLVSITAE